MIHPHSGINKSVIVNARWTLQTGVFSNRGSILQLNLSQ